MHTITRRGTFCASHRLFNPAFSDEENLRIYGKCSNPNGHGHNYVLEVTVAGEVDPDTGMIFNLDLLKDVMQERIIDHVDHRNLNEDVPFLLGGPPTAENLAARFWELLADALPGGRLHRIRIQETENNIVDYYGPAQGS